MKNREIKFRVWDVGNKRWMKDWVGINNFGVIYDDGHGPEDLSLHQNAIIQQYTGVKDRNGKEIYEGDIIKFYKKVNLYNYDYSFRMDYIKNIEKKDKWDFIETKEFIRNVVVVFSEEDVGDFDRVIGWYAKDYCTDSLVGLINEHQIAPCGFMNYSVIVASNFEVIGNIFETPNLLK